MFIVEVKNKLAVFLLLILLIANTSFCNEELGEYLLPQDHWVHLKLDKIFVSKDILENESFLKEAGFKILHNQPSGMKVVKHHLLPSYLIKVYLHPNERNMGLQWAVDRCKGAKNIRDLIKEENLRCFVVPDKWIYLLPCSDPLIAILVVQDMELVSGEETKKAWKNTTKQQIRELYVILSHGFGSCYLVGNIPYTRKGKFACVDTAYPYRQHNYGRIGKYFSSKMQKYWDKLVKSEVDK